MAFPMKNKSYLFVVLLLARILVSYNGYAQTKDSHLTQNYTSKDTALIRQNLKDSFDILKWKENREFSYMHYLDSLLRREKHWQTDTVSVDEKSGVIKRNKINKGQPSSVNNLLNSWPLKTFFWLLAVLFIFFISYKVLFKNGIFTRKKVLHTGNEVESFEELHELSEYDSLAYEAENKNEFNLATRYLYLKTLKNLSDKGFINFTNEKTNKDYINEMHPAFREEFRNLTRDYEYIWYGKFSIDKKGFQKIKEDFSFFNKKI